MSCVFPGLPEVLAIFFWFTNALINEDLPTFDRPTNATSTVASGKVSSRDADSTNEICRGLPELTPQTSQVIEGKVQDGHATMVLNADNHTVGSTPRRRWQRGTATYESEA